MCPPAHPRVPIVTDHKANPSDALWLRAGDLSIGPSPSLSIFASLVKAIDSHGSWDILSLGTCFLHALHPPLMPSVQPIRLALKWIFYFLHLSCLKFSLLESLWLALKSLSYFPFGRLHRCHPSSSRKHTVLAAPPPPFPLSLIKFTLHNCPDPNMHHLLWVFLTRHSFSSWFIWDFCPSSTIYFVLFLSPQFS